MPAWKNLKWLRLTPTRPGTGGMKTGMHTFQAVPVNDTRLCTGAYVHNGAWTREYQTIPIYPLSGQHQDGGGAFNSVPFSVHGYVYPNLLDPAALPNFTILGHNQVALASQHIWDYTHGTVRRANLQVSNQPGVFQNIGGRCFVATGGGTEGMVLDDRTPAIHAQANQHLGISAPTQALGATTLVEDPNLTPWGSAYVPNCRGQAVQFINTPNPNSPIGTIKTTDTVTMIIPNTNMAAMYVGGGIAPAAASPNFDAVTSNITPFPAPGVLSINSGSSVVNLSGGGGTFPANFAYCGLAINFNGYSYVILDHGTRAAVGADCGGDLNGNAVAYAGNQALIGGVYTGPDLVSVPYSITGCQVEMPVPSTVQMNNSNPADVPPGTAFGYSQHTYCNTPQFLIKATQSNGFYRNLGNIDLGPKGGGVPDTVTDISIAAAGFTQVYSPSGPWTPSDIGKTIVIDHAGDAAGTTMLATTIVSVSADVFIGIASPSQKVGGILNKRAWWVDGAIGCVDATNAGGVVSSPSNPWTVVDIGKEIIIATAGVAGDAYFGHIATFGGPGSITVTPVPTLNVGPVQAYWGGAISNTHDGPTYAYAWYDPETGHMSDVAPFYTVPRPTVQGSYADFAGLTPVFEIDPGRISYPNQIVSAIPGAPPTDGIRFSHLVFFRTLSAPGSSTLYPIGSLMPFVGKVHSGLPSTRGSGYPMLLSGWYGLPNSFTVAPPGAISATPPTYWYDFSSDSDLILSGGFRAPQYTNGKPMVTLKGGIQEEGHPYQMVYWDRRTWIVNTQEPNKIAFSCDEAQCPLGLPEESFPPTNFLRLPADDGNVTGMRKVGDMLLVVTDRWAYIIAGNNESNYRLLKVSSFMPGVGTYQMAEYPTSTGVEGEPASLFYLGRDKIVYQWTVGGPAIPISGMIQDQLDAANFNLFNYQRARLHTASAWGRRVLVLGLNVLTAVGSDGLATYIYDIDHGVWTLMYRGNNSPGAWIGTAPMCTVYGVDTTENQTDIGVVELYALPTPTKFIQVRNWLRTDTNAAQGALTLETFPLTFDGKKTRKQIVAVNLHVTASAVNAWGLKVISNESQDLTFTSFFGAYPDPLDSIYGSNPLPVDSTGALDIVSLGAQIVNQPVIGFRSIIRVISANTLPGKIYAIDVGYIDSEETGDGDA